MHEPPFTHGNDAHKLIVDPQLNPVYPDAQKHV
jgi:hypothetical protein